MRLIHVACAVGILCFVTGAGNTWAQSEPPTIPPWAAIVHELALQVLDRGPTSQSTGVVPTVISQVLSRSDPSGRIGTFNVGAPTDTTTNAFFQSMGTNGRACATCHEPRSAWSVSAASIRRRFKDSAGTDPIFRLVDGANCPSEDVSTIQAKRKAYSLLLSKGLIRVFLPLPATQLGTTPPVARDFEITAVNDPYSCTDLSSGVVSVYRRPAPSANLRFLTECPPGQTSCTPLAIMWDGREPSLESQATDATLGHAQAINAPTGAQVQQIVDFESGIYTTQVFDQNAGPLDSRGAGGGPEALSQQDFYIGINDVLGGDPLAPGVFTPVVFNLYDSWQNLAAPLGREPARHSIARGETLFNSKQFMISGVNGLNLFASDPLGANAITGTCTTCHDSPNVGNHSKKLAINIGVADAIPPSLDVSQLPVFTVACTETTGPLKGQTFTVTDLGRALITGSCSDVGKVKGPILHGLAARAPYFHNGSADTLTEVVKFYDRRFTINFTEQEEQDLVAFLKTL
jgi:cytochrome c peroxidase